jgi:hypothetical protein
VITGLMGHNSRGGRCLSMCPAMSDTSATVAIPLRDTGVVAGLSLGAGQRGRHPGW